MAKLTQPISASAALVTSEYKPGVDEDHLVKTAESSSDVDLTVYIKRYKLLKQQILSLPAVKSIPDQETLDHWNNVVVEEGLWQKDIYDDLAKRLYKELKAIKDAGFLPTKYDDEFKQLQNYLKSL